ncbi:unnamed protein product [Schistosoma turkestanicum]|nr:unnamed protein product [Schistosoma turkestanicum]
MSDEFENLDYNENHSTEPETHTLEDEDHLNTMNHTSEDYENDEFLDDIIENKHRDQDENLDHQYDDLTSEDFRFNTEDSNY